MNRLLLAAALAFLPVTTAAHAPPPIPPALPQTPTLRASVDQVVVDVVVTDAAGRPATGLTAADFEVFDRGKPQTITAFTEVVLPLPAARDVDVLPTPSDVRSNTLEDGRIYVVVFDDLHVAAYRTPEVQQTVRRLLARYVHLVAVMTTSGFGDTAREPTPDVTRIDAALSRLAGQGSDVVTGAAVRRAEASRRTRNDDPMAVRRTSTTLMVDGSVDDQDDSGAELQERARLALRGLTNATEALGTIPSRRKTLLFFSEGLPISPRDGEMADARSRLLGAAARANVTIHAFDPKGLSHAEQGPVTGFYTQLRLMRAASLREIAEGTGGIATVDANNLEPALARVALESSRYYLLGYAPPDARRDGRYRAIDVRAKRPGLRVSVRRGYREPDDEAERKAAAKVARRTVGDSDTAVTGPLAPLVSKAIGTRGLPMTVQALAFPGTADNVSLVLEFRPGAVPAAPPAGGTPPRIDFVVVPVAAGGRVLPSIEGHVPLAVDAADARRIEARGVRVIQSATLPPGDYQLRIAARESMRETMGAVFCELTVPESTRGGLQMSGLVVSSSTAGATPSASRDERLERGLGGRPPTTVRTFTTAETVSIYAELVDAAPDAVRDVTLVTVVRDGQGREVVRRTQARANARVAAGQTFGYASDLPLASLPPGAYVLRVEAQAAGGAATVRDVPFDVRAAS